MSYKVTVYFNDENIATTEIYYPNGGFTVTKAYGSTAYSASGFSGTIRFRAYPADGCEFSQWVYRVGGTSADQERAEPIWETDEDGNLVATFYYYGGSDGNKELIIRATGISVESPDIPDDSWQLSEWGILGTVSSELDLFREVQINANSILRGYVNVVETGKVSVAFININRESPCTCYITSTDSWDSTEGIPDDIIISFTLEDGSNIVDFDANEYTQYYIWIRNDGISSISLFQLYLSLTLPATVKKWSWYDSNGSADADETYASYIAVVNKEITTNFFHNVWNDLVDKVKEVLSAKGLAWDTYYATYANTRMTTSPYELTADMFNSLRNNLKFVYDSGIGRVYPGDDVLGSYFTTLAQSMNNAIYEL